MSSEDSTSSSASSADATPTGPTSAPTSVPAPVPTSVPAPFIVVNNDPVAQPAAVLPNAPSTPPASSPKQIAQQLIADTEAALDIQFSAKYKLHAGIALLGCLVSCSAWFFLGFAGSWYPWFVYVFTLFALSLSAHYCLFFHNEPRQWFQFHVCSFITFSCTFFVTWLASHSYSVWFLYPLVFQSWLLSLHAAVLHLRQHPSFKIAIHGMTSVALCLIVVTIYLDTHRGYFWPLPIFYVLAIAIIIHYCYQSSSGLMLAHFYVFAASQVFLFSVWLSIGTSIFPWFVPVLLLWTGLLVLHFLIDRKRKLKKQETLQLPIHEQQPSSTVPQQQFYQQQQPVLMQVPPGYMVASPYYQQQAQPQQQALYPQLAAVPDNSGVPHVVAYAPAVTSPSQPQ